MNKKSLLIFGMASALMLAACGGEKPTSQGSNTPTSSVASKPASSSKSSTSKAPVKSMSVAGLDVVVENGKTYLVVTGSAKNFAEGEFKWAWGLEHVNEVDGGEGFIYGSASPADADYKENVTVAADGTYTAKFCLSDVTTLAQGLYKVYAGAKGFYGNIDPNAGATISTGRVKDDNFSYNFRSDEQCDSVAAIAVDSLPPIKLTEAEVYAEGDQTWVKIGGDSKLTAEEASKFTPYVNFQTVDNGWGNTKRDGDNIKWDFSVEGKAYICANISFFQANRNYNTHLNLKENKQQDCKMEVAIDETFYVNGKAIRVYSNPEASSDDKTEFWGNLGFRVSNIPAPEKVDNETLISKADAYNRAAIRATSKIATGEYKITTDSPYYEEPQTTVGTYAFDDEKAYFHQQNYTIFVDTYVYYEGENLVAYEIADGDPARPTTPREDLLSGVDFSYSAGFNPASIDLFGAEAFLNNAFAYAKTNANGDLSGELTYNGYNLSFLNAYDGGYGFIDYKYVTISAGFDAKSNILSSLKVTTKSYDASSIEVGETAKIIADAEPTETKILEITQKTGERSVVPPYKVSDFNFTAFNLYDAEGNKIANNGTYETEIGEWGQVELYYDDVAPAGASTSFDPINITCDDPAFQYGNAREGVISLNFSAAGTYQVTLATKSVSYTITVKATAPKATAMEVYEMAWSWGMFSSTYMAPSHTRVGDEIYFRAFVEPQTSDQSYTVSVAGDASRYTLETRTGSDWSGDYTYTAMVCNEVGDYTITVTSTANPELQSTFTITAEAALNMDSVITGKFQFGYGEKGYATFTPNTETTALDGTVVLERDGKTGTYSYVQETGSRKANLTHVSGDQVMNQPSIAWDGDGNLTITEVVSYDWGNFDETFELSPANSSTPGGEDEGGGIGIF